MKNKQKSIVWFRKDLRIVDNPALAEATRTGSEVIPLYIDSDDGDNLNFTMGEASQWWLHNSLASLNDELKGIGSKLIFRKGNSFKVLKEIIQETGTTHVFWNRLYEPEKIERDKKIKSQLKAIGCEAISFNGSLLFEPWTIKNKQGGPYKVYTAFWNCVSEGNSISKPIQKVRKISIPTQWPKTLKLHDLKLKSKKEWADGFNGYWNPGRKGAMKSLKAFLKEAVFHYEETRNLPHQVGTSRLSPHLHFGELSAREVWSAVKKSHKTIPYLRQIIWREFAHHLLYHFPHTVIEPLDPKFKKFKWKNNQKHLQAWQKGLTGYPIVDAGMRELWHTGWMHNRVRMIVGSFLVKDLMIPWQEGAKWFWDTLVDADLANNTMGWQWIAGCGADASPYFRIFNPMTQSEKFDSRGEYIRKWIPEIAKLSDKAIHQPWMATDEDLRQANIKLGKTYPKPIVDHSSARKSALMAYERIRSH